MSKTVKTPNRKRRRLLPPIELADRLEHAKALDGVIGRFARGVQRRIRGRQVRDALHGVFFGHPVHPPLTMVTTGCWISAVVLDAAGAGRRARRTLLATGLAAALPTAATGLMDWSRLHREHQRVGLVHATANLAATGLCTGSLLLRLGGRERGGKVAALAGLAAAGFGGYLGGHMAFRQAAGASHAESVTHLVELGWHDLSPLPDLPDGTPVPRSLGYITLFVLRRGEEVTVMADRCSHLGGPLHRGRVTVAGGEECVVCPWHESTFRLSDGRVVHGPATAPQPAFETRIRGDGMVQVRPIP